MITILTALLALASSPAHAARSGTIDASEAKLRASPQDEAPVKRILPRGTRLEASNEPIEGYHKVRLESGELGFVSSRDLYLAPVVGGGSPFASLFRSDKVEGPGAVKRGLVRIGGGFGLAHFTDLNSLIGFDRFSNPLNFSLEVGIKILPSWMLLLGGDYSMHSLTMSGSVVKSTTTVTRTYAFSESAMVARVGVAFLLVNEEGWLIELGAMGAVAPVVTVTAQVTAAETTDISTASPNTTTLTGMGFGAVARILIERRIWSGLGLTVEGGFRYIPTATVIPASSVNGSDLFMENSAFVPVSLQLTGFYAQAGLAWAF